MLQMILTNKLARFMFKIFLRNTLSSSILMQLSHCILWRTRNSYLILCLKLLLHH